MQTRAFFVPFHSRCSVGLQDALFVISLLTCGRCFPAVKPRSPQVWNVTFHREPYQALIHVRTPYHRDYLTTENQLFQLHIWTATSNMVARTRRCLSSSCVCVCIYWIPPDVCAQTQNISSLDKIVLRIDEAHLRKNTKYQVKVRAIPNNGFQGTWSEWSQPYSFSTAPGKKKKRKVNQLCRWSAMMQITKFYLSHQKMSRSRSCGRHTHSLCASSLFWSWLSVSFYP